MELIEAAGGLVLVGVFGILSWGATIRRVRRQLRRQAARARTRPTIPNLVALPRPAGSPGAAAR